MSSVLEIQCTPYHVGKRLDHVLKEILSPVSRAALKAHLSGGGVRIHGDTITRGAYKIKASDVLTIDPLEKKDTTLIAEEIPLDIVYEDSSLIVVNKPAGMVVHPGAGHKTGTLVQALLHHCSLSPIGLPLRPGLVHRLDKDTSGLLMVAKTEQTHLLLSNALKRRQIKRCYQAIVWGRIKNPHAIITAPIGRDPKKRQRMSVTPKGQKAQTEYTVLKRWNTMTKVQCLLHTGKTHQIRVHFTSLGHSLVGDQTYQSPHPFPHNSEQMTIGRRFTRQALHASSLSFPHPITGQPLTLNSPLPQDIQTLLEKLSRVNQKTTLLS